MGRSSSANGIGGRFLRWIASASMLRVTTTATTAVPSAWRPLAKLLTANGERTITLTMATRYMMRSRWAASASTPSRSRSVSQFGHFMLVPSWKLLHLGLRLPSHEARVDLLEDLRVEHLLGRELLLDPVQRVE